ncbi:nucleic-acid-binding protein from mobile element jockey [Lasius niger]|uniref:Nucleic-acid-binding protein from mobile element jockey n=1 Tax=Lasius niger TaxID=67767 RepID=A0A0J7K3A9_LASNI|nr:nucleic-acid-binding protein from mobile element jockey [Lasius niger]
MLERQGTARESLQQPKEKEDNRFEASHREDIIITAKLNSKKCTTKGDINFLRIIDKVMETKVKSMKVVKSGFNSIDLYYDSIIKANKCLDLNKGILREEQDIWFDIMERIARRKEVISDWDMSLLKLSEALDDKNKIISAEKMRKQIFNGETKTFEWIDIKNILVTFERNELPEKLSLYEGLTAIRVRPYIPAVKQCFKCYKYGHIKQYCKKEYNLCVVCGRESHGNCENEYKCINCGGKHKTNFKGCPI